MSLHDSPLSQRLVELTPSQRAAVEHRDGNLLLSASAGSGKTEVLARRCVALLTDAQRPCGVDELLVVTFTRAAAAELRVRIARMLREEAGRTASAKLREHLKRQEILVDAADIGTIDAWCGRIVREHFVEAGVDPRFATLNGEQAALLRHEVLDQLFDWLYTSSHELAIDARAWIRRSKSPSDEFLRSLVAAMHARREQMPDPQSWLAVQTAVLAAGDAAARLDAERVLADSLRRECALQYEQLAALLPHVGEADAHGLRLYHEKLREWEASLADHLHLMPVIAALTKSPFPKKKAGDTARGPLLDEVKKHWWEHRLKAPWSVAQIDAIVENAPAVAKLALTLLRLAERYNERLVETKRRRAVCEFGDVQRLALDLLGRPSPVGVREPTAIARRLRARYAHVLVDEYQDTSPVQVELLRLAARNAAEGGNCFMVGDVKQSIYGFRDAEPRLFARLASEYTQQPASGRVRYLSDNFRSHARVVNGLNAIFGVLFDPALGGSAYGPDERLQAQREELDNPTLDSAARVELHVIEDPGRGGATPHSVEEDAASDAEGVPADDEPLTAEKIEREAVLTARRIRAMFEAEVRIPHRDAEKRLTLRPLRFGDIVILLRAARQNASIVARVLRDSGIPAATSGRESLLDTREGADIRSVLALLASRRQDVPLAAYLRGPMVGLSERELLDIRRHAPHGEFSEAVEAYRRNGSDAQLHRRLIGGLDQLDRWATAAREHELPALLLRILRDTDYELFVRGLPGGEHRAATLRSLLGFAEAFAAAGQQGVAEFVAYLDALADQEIEAAAPLNAGEDVVRVMTIHAAKGLEFPVVLLLGTDAAFSRRPGSGDLLVDAAGELGLRFDDYRARTTLQGAWHHVLNRRRREREQEEELRLLYVAATRAREHLVLVGHSVPGRWSAVRELHPPAGHAPALLTRLAAKSVLEWLLIGAAASGVSESVGSAPPLLQVITHAADALCLEPAAAATLSASDALLAAATDAWSTDDEAWLQRGLSLIGSSASARLSHLPAVLSVSAAKELALRDRSADRPTVLGGGYLDLAAPSFAGAAEVDRGRLVGTACHRFLQYADLAQIASPAAVQSQLAQMQTVGRLSAAEAALVPVDDVAWFGASSAGQWLAARQAACMRETPFVYALPAGGDDRILVRGVIDCICTDEQGRGLRIVDYKTDRVPDETTMRERVAGYSVQLQLYAAAASSILGRSVQGAQLVFLQGRCVVDVPLDRIDWAGVLPPEAPAAG